MSALAAPIRLSRPAEALQVAEAPRTLRLLLAMGTQIRRGGVRATLPDGRCFLFQGPAPGTEAAIRIRRTRMARRLLLGGGVGLAEAYLDGDWESDDLCALLTMAAANEEVFSEELLAGRGLRRLLNRLVHLLRRNSRRGSRRNIAEHYDLGNDFYAAWLDETLTYSAGVYADGANSLEAAQLEKYRRLAAMLQLRPEHHVLEIGCGWGGFAAYLGREVGCRVTAITISREQHALARRRITEAGLDSRVQILLRDYRDTAGTYDRIASIEMVEAVGERFWPLFFATLRDRLRPGGRAALQAITIADRYFENYRASPDFIQRHVFPGGMLPAPSVLRAQTAAAGLRWERDDRYGPDYARTLAEWQQRFAAAWPGIAGRNGFDARFRRLWDYYLAYCRAGFLVGFTDVHQIALVRE